MEVAGHKQGVLMKSKLIMSFYRAAKPSPAVQFTPAVVKPRPASLVKKVSFNHEDGSSDGYVHGSAGGGEDEHVDNKATSYIFHVKERLKLEESNLLKGENCTK
ncbi:hypothetical protein BUALT_Bualt17G0016200 [Buddleja alternifolia]|uniref:Uncharacterized protein n=1 Tax=Buddleja alternifolia TaxID=168488 RepID=A0AAV6W5M1_9LAMI|nr:hypothetical protein BUALT_Bualt17G0016200 [Buddleja alternifolia]